MDEIIDLRGRTILIADDNDVVRLVVRAMLDLTQCRVIEAIDGNETIDLVRRERPDLVLLDIMMPDVGGHEAYQVIRNDPDVADTKVIFLTALDDPDTATITVDNAHFLRKPVSPLELIMRVSEVLDQS